MLKDRRNPFQMASAGDLLLELRLALTMQHFELPRHKMNGERTETLTQAEVELQDFAKRALTGGV